MESTDDRACALAAFRKHAAERSGGTSDDVLHGRVLREIERLDLRGNIFDFGAGVGNLTRAIRDSGRFADVAVADLPPFLRAVGTRTGMHLAAV